MASRFHQDEVPDTSTIHPALDDFFAELQRDAAAKRQKTLEREQQHRDARKSKALRGEKEDSVKMPQEVMDCVVAWAMPDAVIVAVRHSPAIPPTIVNWDHFKLVLRLMCVNRETMEEALKYVAKHTVLRVDMMRSLTKPRYEHDERDLQSSYIESLGRVHRMTKPSFSILEHMKTLQVHEMRLLDLNYVDNSDINTDRTPQGSSDFYNRYLLRYTNTYAVSKAWADFEHISFDVQKFTLSSGVQPAHAHALDTVHYLASAFKADHNLSELELNSLNQLTWPNGDFYWPLRDGRQDSTGHRYNSIIEHALTASSPGLRQVWYRPFLGPNFRKMCVVLWSLQQTLALYEQYKSDGDWEEYEPEVPEEQSKHAGVL